MIQYLLKKDKGGVNDGEDKKTSLIFEPLSYLPSDILWKVLRAACADNDTMPKVSGNMNKAIFWPSQSAKDSKGHVNTTNSNRVEPDVIFKFEKFTLIIEAKLKDVQNYKQHVEQWQNELKSYRNEGNKETVIMLAVGGNESMQHYSKGGLELFKCSWYSLLCSICDMRDALCQETHSAPHIVRILNDLELIFSYYREYKIKHWAKDIGPHNISLLSHLKLPLWKI